MRTLLGLFAVGFMGAGCTGAAVHGTGGHDGGVGPLTDAGAPTDATVGQMTIGDSGLPTLPQLTNVTAVQREDSVGIDFDPVDDAKDYRVYPLPTSPSDIINNADGSVTIKNAIYRCAGLRQGWDLENNLNTGSSKLSTFNSPFNWKAQTAANPTLGYVYVTPAADRVPVYAVAGYLAPPEMGGVTPELGWRESRFKIYTTDTTQRQMLLDQNWRDDGIVFYVPAAAGANTTTVYGSQKVSPSSNGAGDQFTQHQQYYFTAADMASHSGDTNAPAAAFQVLTSARASADPPTKPLMAVFYSTDQGHTELAVGNERYQRALNHGNGPLWHLEWAGLTQPTTLVVEALSSGCPYQGFLSAQHLESPPHQTFNTLAELQTASATGEVFINGEYDNVAAAPVPVARSFINVAPQPHVAGDWDWYQGFNVGTDSGPVTPIDFKGSQTNTTCTWEGCRMTNSIFDVSAYELDQPANNPAVFTWGQFQGQLWDAFDDSGQDVTGRVRFTALQTATVAADSYLHVAMAVNIVDTGRRYPQMIVTDQPAPIDCYGQAACGGGNGVGTATTNTLLIQTIGGPSMRLETQAIHGLVNGAPWNVNNQAKAHALLDYDTLDLNVVGANMGADPPFSKAGMDQMVKFDAYVSSQKLYVFMDGAPAGCTAYPAGFALQGTVTVTFGDVLYHETADDSAMNPELMAFVQKHQFMETSRHFDDLGFKSGVAAPKAPASGTGAVLSGGFSWDETKLPCGTY